MLFFSYLLITLSAVLNQSAAIYERGSLYSSLNYDGYPHEDVAGFAPYRGFRSAGAH